MAKNRLVVPFLKWVGGKRQLIPTIKKRLPKGLSNCSYYEPFIGGGALLFELQPKRAIINDYNEELINVYKVIRDNPDELIEDLKKHENTADYFYEIRAIDRKPSFKNLSKIERASPSKKNKISDIINIIVINYKCRKTYLLEEKLLYLDFD